MTDSRARCVVADDHPALLGVVTTFLGDHDFDVVATAPDGKRAVDAVASTSPDVIVSDYRMPYLEGPVLLRALKDACPEAVLVVYTADADRDLCENALTAGAAAIVLKEAPLHDLRRAIGTALMGQVYLDPSLAQLALGRNQPPSASLTPREADVLALLAEGLSHEEIGSRLSISAETVRTHVRKACDRLGAATRTQAVATALREGLIS